MLVMRPFILVHGSFSGGWVWRFLAPLLRAAGHEVHAPTLTGLGANSHLSQMTRISLGTHIQDVTNTLYYEDLSDVVLVGHSYAGMIITGVAAKSPKRLAHLVYFDAYLPREGESERDLWPADQLAKYRADIAAGIGFREPLAPSFLGITDPKMAEWVRERLTPHPLSTYEDPPPSGTTEGASIPRTYIHCILGPIALWMQPFADRSRRSGWNVYTLAAGHCAQLTHPKELAEILLKAAE